MSTKLVKKILLISLLTIFISGCSLPGLGPASENTIKIGTQNYTEPIVVGYILKEMLEHHTDLEIEMVENMGATTVVHNAMTSKEVDISSVRYVGTDLTGTLGLEAEMDPKKALEKVQNGFNEKFNETWFDPYGFENTYAFTVRSNLAESKNLKSISDVAPFAQELRLGVDNDWLQRKGDGYNAFTEIYGYEFGDTKPMQIGLVYEALAHDKMDIVLAYSTDGRIKEYDLTTLKDDKNFFPPYQGSAVVNNEALEQYPEIGDVINKLVGKIDTVTVTDLNYQVDVLKKEPAEVAKEYLESHHYFE